MNFTNAFSISKKRERIIMNVLLNIVFWLLVIGIAYYLSPIHEVFHYIPCKMVGLSPQMSYFQVVCGGIEKKSHTVQFLYFMLPYLFYGLLLLLGYFYAKRYFYIKYLIPIPAFDIIFNFIYAAVRKSDFLFLAQNTYPNQIPFILSMILASFIMLLTAVAIMKLKIYSFNEVIEKYLALIGRLFRRKNGL